MDMKEHRAIEAQAAEWLARRDAVERWTEADERALQSWIAESSAHRVAWLRLGAAWQRTDRMPALSALPAVERASDVAPAPDDGARDATHGTSIGSWTRAGLATAAALLIAVGAWWGVHSLTHEGQQFATVVGGREAVALADGSRVTLNTRTRGRAVVNERRRHFWLEEGEAYFEVAHDPSRPFVITAGDDTITVLGTRFSVRHVDGRTEVTVVEGRVRLDLARPRGAAPPAPVVLTGNEAALAEGGSVLVIDRTEEQVASRLSWRKGQISFDQQTLTGIAQEFNRYNHVQLVVKGEAANMRLSGNFDAENVEAFARLAQEGLGLRVVREGDYIVLSGD